MSHAPIINEVVEGLRARYGEVTPFGRSRQFRCDDQAIFSVNYSKLLRGDKYFFGVSREVMESESPFDTEHGAFVLLICGAADRALVLPRPLIRNSLEAVNSRRIDVFIEGGRYILQTTGHPKLDVTRFLNAYPESPTTENKKERSVDSEKRSVREHVAVQWDLIRLGRAAGHTVWVPPGDRHLGVGPSSFEGFTLNRLPYLGFGEVARRVVQNIDVLWMDHGIVRQAFEIESTTTIYSGLLRLNDLVLAQPNASVRLSVAAPDSRRAEVRRQLFRPSFHQLAPKCSFLSFEYVHEQAERLDFLGELGRVTVRGLLTGEAFDLPDSLTYPAV